MENVEFISAANLPIVEGDEVNVLCVEDGELKQKPVSNNTNYDIVVRVIPAWDEEEDMMSTTAQIISGSYDAVMQKLDADIIPKVLLIENGTGYDNYKIKAVSESFTYWISKPGVGEGLILFSVDGAPYLLQSDGTVFIY